ncbi:MAG: Gfo/Idh/MocA family oxidoreductase [Deltaproteobacteria bacterium]|nr:Gfo/Idh/MocA family oxidoreductase [Deltaproteobacteria bacterium]
MPDQHPVRFGTLGAAQITPNALIKPALEVRDAEIVAVAARNRKRAEEFAATHRIGRVHDTYQQVIDDPEVDVIYNPLPNSHHCQWTIAALRAGKHVLCEKPIASNAAEAQRMAAVARETGRFLGEAFHYRYHPLAARVRELIRGGTLGRLRHLEGNFSVPLPATNIRYDWDLAGGATMDLGCYPLHMLREFSGLTPRVVKASARIGPPNIDVAMEVELELGDGVTGRMTCSMAQDTQIGATFAAHGELGELYVFNPVAPQMGNQLTLKTSSGEQQQSVAGDASYTAQLRAFVARIRGDQSAFPTDGAEAIINMRIIDDVYRAAGLPPRASAK